MQLPKIFMGFFISVIVVKAYALSRPYYHQFKANTTMEFSLPVNEPVYLSNPTMWKIIAKCEIQSAVELNTMRFTMIKKSGSLDGTTLSETETIDLTLHINQYFNVISYPGSKVMWLNIGEVPFKAICSLR
jgi:hypothetical protein